MNNVFVALYNKILSDKDDFNLLMKVDKIINLNIGVDEILNFLEFSNDIKNLNGDINNNIIITEGDVISILRIIHDLAYNTGYFLLYINDDNKAIITYIVKNANSIYKELNIEVEIKIDYSKNYNNYLENDVTIVGSEVFVNTAKEDFANCETIIV